jgi:hypothetical protein
MTPAYPLTTWLEASMWLTPAWLGVETPYSVSVPITRRVLMV